ncbi:hypothetical protein Mapa_011176 [Marchantia paleacea]|nr:hypothetical protein Mapa_011176 [Marchantia paleacea]
MASRRFLSFSGWCAATANSSCPQFQDGLQQLLGSLITRHVSSSAVLIEDKHVDVKQNLEKAPVTLEKWVELPPVPKAVPVRPTWGQKLLEADGSYEEDKKYEIEVGAHELTAVRWVAKCCPSVPNSLIQKLFRLRQVSIYVLSVETSSACNMSCSSKFSLCSSCVSTLLVLIYEYEYRTLIDYCP